MPRRRVTEPSKPKPKTASEKAAARLGTYHCHARPEVWVSAAAVSRRQYQGVASRRERDLSQVRCPRRARAGAGGVVRCCLA